MFTTSKNNPSCVNKNQVIGSFSAKPSLILSEKLSSLKRVNELVVSVHTVEPPQTYVCV